MLKDSVMFDISYYSNLVAEKIKLLKKIEELPKELQELNGTAYFSSDHATVDFYGGREVMHNISQLGAVFTDKSFSSYNGKFTHTGKLGDITVRVSNVDPADGCKIITKKEIVTRYEIICSEEK